MPKKNMSSSNLKNILKPKSDWTIFWTKFNIFLKFLDNSSEKRSVFLAGEVRNPCNEVSLLDQLKPKSKWDILKIKIKNFFQPPQPAPKPFSTTFDFAGLYPTEMRVLPPSDSVDHSYRKMIVNSAYGRHGVGKSRGSAFELSVAQNTIINLEMPDEQKEQRIQAMKEHMKKSIEAYKNHES